MNLATEPVYFTVATAMLCNVQLATFKQVMVVQGRQAFYQFTCILHASSLSLNTEYVPILNK